MSAAPAHVPSPLATLTVLTTAYVLSQYFRTAIAVVAPEISRDLQLDPASLGALSSAWFWAFALAQIPVGVALDRYGPRRVTAALLTSAGLGCFLFASADGLAQALLGQALIGIGCAPVFMGTLVVLTRFFAPHRFALLSSTILAIGNGGTLLGTTPLALAVGHIGWRGTFLAMAGIVLAVAALTGLIARDGPDPARAPRGEGGLAEAVRGVSAVLRNRWLWPILPLSFSGYAVLITVRGLWAGPYLADAFGLGPVGRGNVLLGMSCATILGTLGYGLIERRLGRRRPVIVGSTGVALALVLLALGPITSPIVAAALLAALGALGATYPLIMAQGRQFLADHEVGRGLTFLNGICFIGAASVQAGSGLVIAVGGTSPEEQSSGYTLLFLALALLLTTSIAVFCRSSDVRPHAAANRMDGR